jgi:hypothetical protein
VKATGRSATLGADKAYDVTEHGANLRAMGVTPHPARNNGPTKTGKTRKTRKTRTTIVDDETAESVGYGMSQTRRKMIECIFGWGKQHGTMRKTKHRSVARVGSDFMLNIIAYNLVRIPKLVTV